MEVLKISLLHKKLLNLKLKGEMLVDETTRHIYATDASAYREIPLAVFYPACDDDLKEIITFASENKIGLIPRTAGTSLAGQVVGNGLIIDLSRHYNKILEVNIEEKWVRVQPGVVLDELNQYLKPMGLFFGPETSTSNRCMIGGMVGNNACGAHSLVYGSTRDHLLEAQGFLSDGSFCKFENLNKNAFEAKCEGTTLEANVYRNIAEILGSPENQQSIIEEYPNPLLKRRNTGYALDLLLQTSAFGKSENEFNFCKLIAGSEGTLMLGTEFKLNLVELPLPAKALVCIHFNTLEESLLGNLVVLDYKPCAIELIDSIIINCTKDNIEQRRNRFFIEGNPEAILLVEFVDKSIENIKERALQLETEMRAKGFGYHFPLVEGNDINKVWSLRKAALGLLSNIKGDAKPVSLIEDTAVLAEYLPEYIADIKAMLNRYSLHCVFHAHIATGELHMRPVLNLKKTEDRELFRKVATDTAHLVKKYKGSLSGEHGDGRLRGEFIPIIIGERNFALVKKLKQTWDLFGIFNPGKIVATPPMDSFLRNEENQFTEEPKTYFDFSESDGFMRHIERCNGSGDCRKSDRIGGTMCPSFMATKNEYFSTRARANALREFLKSPQKNIFDHKEVKEILDECLSCKACKSECPSNVDMTKLKAEFMQQYYNIHGIPLRARLIGNMTNIYRLGSMFPRLFNYFTSQPTASKCIKRLIGFTQYRNIPRINNISARKWAKENIDKLNSSLQHPKKEICIFIDEFTNYTDAELGIKSILLLHRLGYKLHLSTIQESGRTYISKGMIYKAKKFVFTNVNLMKNVIESEIPIVGIEPSAILTFRDEYPDLLEGNAKVLATKLAQNSFLIEEFLYNESVLGNIAPNAFKMQNLSLYLHGHCYVKSLIGTQKIKHILQFSSNNEVKELATGCCGMAGAFGYEAEHYELSMQIGELQLFPIIRKLPSDTIIVASGSSCREQILHGTNKKAFHPAEILYNSLA